MASPIRPSDIKDTLPTTDGSACVRLKKVLVDFPRRVYEWFSYVYNEDGTFTEAFKTDFCAIPCDNITEETGTIIVPGTNNPGNALNTPVVTAGAGLNHAGGIPLVWNPIAGATKYDIWRGTTNSPTANTTILLRKGLEPSTSYIGGIKNKLVDKNGSLIYYDVNGGKVYVPNIGDQKTNTVNGQIPYYYWVIARGMGGSSSDMSSTAIGFSRYVTNFAPIGIPKLLWSGQTVALSSMSGASGPNQMRVVLRGGGGAGGGGGDWMLPTYTKWNITSITWSGVNNDITLVVHQSDVAAEFKRGDVLTIEDAAAGNTKWERDDFVVDSVDNALKTIVLKPTTVDLEAPVQNGQMPGDASKDYYGRLFANKRKHPTAVAGAGGGAGGILQVVFNLNNTGTDKQITHIKVETQHSASTVVNYDPDGASGFGRTRLRKRGFVETQEGEEYIPYNEGGKGRQSDATADAPKAGEPKAGTLDNNTTDVGPYRTCLFISTDSGSNWSLVAWVGDGEGGGYSDGANSTAISVGGEGSKQHYWKTADGTFQTSAGTGYVLSRFGTKDVTDICTLRGTALGGDGLKFFRGENGGNGVGASDDVGGGSPGYAGAAWDSYVPAISGGQWAGNDPQGNDIVKDPQFMFASQANGFDESAPGGGGNGAWGKNTKHAGPEAWGGHAFAGSAYITYKAANVANYDDA